MSLSESYLKQLLSQTYQVKPENILEKSKSKDEQNQNIRVFEVDSLEVVVVSDPGDNAVVEFFLSDEDMVELLNENFDQYVFAVSKLKIGQGLIAIVHKKVWQHGGIQVMPDEEFNLLPEYISDIDGSIISQLSCVINTKHTDIIEDLENLGFTYSNSLALFLNKTEGENLFQIHFRS